MKVPKGDAGENRAEEIFEEVMAKNFLEITKFQAIDPTG